MAKIKLAKKSSRVDMTAMCDVAFLLLSFFIMTATAKVPEALPVETPASTVQTKLPEDNLGTLSIADSKVFFGITGRDLRVEALTRMGDKYQVSFTEQEKERFSLIDGFGVDIRQMKTLIAMDNSERMEPGKQPGIPYDSINNQLAEWIKVSREVTKDLHSKDLDIAIKGDAKEEYPTVKKVLDILQKQSKNNFFLVTGLRSEDDF
ncbi:biopolymer transporter ExbD [Flavobacterium sp. NST-5]|uniref:Biopolymer transporter ExbD n=1 Tax=Flavobacterium ichthyis TaxID=2698827 RepID=A0ABW9ZDV8_9FLAO|nr:biopolymer transporter ExbD [Flavobacterium ichthyis]NBL65487.1 biopolymer transporter ExbD [Flavobacterium ichthyis]